MKRSILLLAASCLLCYGTALPLQPPLPDIVISEILFNPVPQGTDYVELYNRSNQSIDLKGWRLANRNAAGTIGSIKVLPASAGLVSPGEYRVLTDAPSLVQQTYYVRDPATLLPLGSLPSYPDARGTVVLLDAQSKVVDEVAYDEKWHFALLASKTGVALERIDCNKSSQDPANWHSAASGAGYGTPGYKNSQYGNYDIAEGTISIDPPLFSPDNDGRDDYAIVRYRFPEPGYVCNLTLFNIYGLPVKYLARNALCGTSGYYRWDGMDEKGRLAPTGNYILLSESFNLQGLVIKQKKVITLYTRH